MTSDTVVFDSFTWVYNYFGFTFTVFQKRFEFIGCKLNLYWWFELFTKLYLKRSFDICDDAIETQA